MKITTSSFAQDAFNRFRGWTLSSLFLLFTTGQNAAFSLPFSKIGLFLKTIKSVIRTMADRIAARGAFSSAEVAEGLSEPVTVKGIESGRDADTGEKLLWVETTDSGGVCVPIEWRHRRSNNPATSEPHRAPRIGTQRVRTRAGLPLTPVLSLIPAMNQERELN